MNAHERRAATRAIRQRLDHLRNAIAEQDATLYAAHARADARTPLNVTPQALERFELLCTVPELRARTSVAWAKSARGVRC
jgi:hypothetical protein